MRFPTHGKFAGAGMEERQMLISDRYPYLDFQCHVYGECFRGTAYVDTGFNGGIVVPESCWSRLWPVYAEESMVLGDGSATVTPSWRGLVRIGDQSFQVRVVCIGDEFIIGREVIDRARLCLHNGEHLVLDFDGPDPRLRPCIFRLTPYLPGKPIEEVKRELGLDDVIKMASNENVLGPSPKAIEAIRNLAPEVFYYPEGSAPELRKALAEKWSVTPEQVILGNGSDELLVYIGLAVLNPGDQIIQADPTFSEYRYVATLCGAEVVSIPMKDLTHDLAAMKEAVTGRTKLLFIANPNNPTGAIVTRQEVETLWDGLPQHVTVVFDEAYSEYAESEDYPDGLQYVREDRNVIVLRTFSKAYALAGLRVGYAIASEEIVGYLNKLRQPFNVNSVAQAAAVASLRDTDQVPRTQKLNSEGKRYLCEEFDRLGLKYAPSDANFIFVDTGKDSKEVFQALMQKGVIVRTGDIFGYPTHIRVTIATPAMNQRFIRELKTALHTDPANAQR